MGFVRGLITVVTLATFLGICWWAYRPSSRARFEADGWLAFDDDESARLGAGAAGDDRKSMRRALAAAGEGER
ncbi:MAG: cbb3-type cytochrome c oxidase subunit 3 [Spirochaetaceae bacterium]|nr:cbb3-type cytochrome c oxidase subunit 3 [Myxococcales bacterium]MCB9722431.1 cbb3-type cytochrome c oxidase subunit 3 [Spirochaetaceae bacterium]HPG28783.1 cbb3-type cytochrome c oxidase subunit 3 [Myxococcota bacterium]